MTAPASPTAPIGVVYLVHFTEPYRHARHYRLDRRSGQPARRAPGRTWRAPAAGDHPGRDPVDARANLARHTRARTPAQAPGRRLTPVPDLPRQPKAVTMTKYRVVATDEVQPDLAGHEGDSYQSLPQPREHALALARALTGVAQLPDEHGPWRQARPGGTRTVRIEPVP